MRTVVDDKGTLSCIFLQNASMKTIYKFFLQLRYKDVTLSLKDNLSYMTLLISLEVITQPAFTCSKLTIETLEQSVKYVQS